MEILFEAGALIIGFLSIAALAAQSMISINRNLKARQTGNQRNPLC